MKWRKHPPMVEETQPEAFWFARGHPFNRPVVVRVNAGVRQRGPNWNRRFEQDVNFNFLADGYEGRDIWRDQLDMNNLGTLEWAGPFFPPV